MLRRGNLTGFILKTVICLIFVAAGWYFIAPGYNRVLMSLSTLFIPEHAWLQLAQNNLNIISTGGDMAGGIYLLSLHYGLVLVIVLTIATPGMTLLRRLKSLGIAAVLIVLLNVASIALFARSALAGSMQNPLLVLFAVLGSDLFPLVIWAGLSYRYFLRPGTIAGLKATRRVEGQT